MSRPSQWPLPEKGIRFLTPTFMLSKLARHPLTRECYPAAMGFYPNARYHSMERPKHDDNLLIYCTEGCGRVSTQAWSGAVGPGDVLVLPQGVAHAYQADSESPWTIYWVHYQGSTTAVFNQYLGFSDATSSSANIGLSPQLIGHFRDMLEVRRTGYSTRAFINAANQLRHLLTQIALDIRRAQARSQHSFNLDAVHSFMLEHIDQKLDLDSLAATARLSKYHFANKYKALTGYSPIKHFLNMKIQHACHLLDSSAMSVKSVAAALGYEDQLYFSRLFTRTVGMSPRAYRSSVRK